MICLAQRRIADAVSPSRLWLSTLWLYCTLTATKNRISPAVNQRWARPPVAQLVSRDAMKENRDPWYVRLPDGRVLKAKSTDAVRHHLEAGNIPRNSYARRDPTEEWVELTWIAEFSPDAARRRAEEP